MQSSYVRKIVVLCVRLALAASFLSAVADRFGLWGASGTGSVAWGNFPDFIGYTQMLLWYLPAKAVTVFAWVATVLEVLFAVGLLLGIKLRLVSAASAILMLLFALSMTFATGAEGPLSYSVWTASAAAMLLATLPSDQLGPQLA